MGWFTTNAPQPVYPGGSATFDETAGAVSVPTGQTAAPQPTMQPNSGGGDYQSTFMRIMGGLPATPQNLAAKEQELAAAGITVKRNAEGTAGKIKLPTGQIVDVIQSAGTGGGGNWQWLTGSGGSGGMGGSLGNFQVGTFTGGGQYPLSSVNGTGLAAPWLTPFNAPDPNSVTNDQALQWQMGRGMDAIQRSAAAKGTLLTGGTLKALNSFGQGLASTYYNDVYNRKLGEYQMAHNIFEENQGNLFNRLFGVSGMGLNAAGSLGNYGNAYGTNATNLQTGMGAAQSAGTVGVGNAIGNAVGGVLNGIGQTYGGGGSTPNTSSYNPQAVGPAYGAPGYVQGTGAPWNTYQQDQYTD